MAITFDWLSQFWHPRYHWKAKSMSQRSASKFLKKSIRKKSWLKMVFDEVLATILSRTFFSYGFFSKFLIQAISSSSQLSNDTKIHANGQSHQKIRPKYACECLKKSIICILNTFLHRTELFWRQIRAFRIGITLENMFPILRMM